MLLLGALLPLMLIVSCAATQPTPAASLPGATGGVFRVYGDQLRPLGLGTHDGVVLNVYIPGGQVALGDASGGARGMHYSLEDHLGSARVVAGVVGHSEYGPYGETVTVGTNHYYAGHPYAQPLSIYQTPTRAYDATSGRFLSTDLQRQDASPYIYAGDNPVGYLDVTGDVRVPYFMKSGYPGRKRYAARSVAELFGIHSNQRVRDIGPFRTNKTGFSSADRTPKRLLYGDTFKPGDREFEYDDHLFWLMDAPEEVPPRMPTAIDNLRDVESSFARKFVILDFTRSKEVRKTQRALETEGISVLRIRSKAVFKYTQDGGRVAKKFIVGGQDLAPDDFRSYVDDKMFEKWPTRNMIIPRWMLKPKKEGEGVPGTSDSSDPGSSATLGTLGTDHLGGAGPGPPAPDRVSSPELPELPGLENIQTGIGESGFDFLLHTD